MKTNATAVVMKITPAQASEWLLEKWGEQRTLRRSQVDRLASDMESGRFLLSPDAILRVKGKLANGQHRMAAVAQCGKAQTFIVMESNDEDLYKVIDAGLRRTVTDGLIGISYSKSVPAIARWVQAYYLQSVSASDHGPSKALYNSARMHPTQSQMIDYCLEHKQILGESAGFIAPLYQQTRILPFSIGGALYVIANNLGNGHLEKAKAFLSGVYVDGGNSGAGDLRNRLIANKGSKSKMQVGYLFGITIKAFKSYLNGTRPGVLKWAKDEVFPTLQ